MRRGHVVACVAAVLLIANPTAAQEAGQVGVTMGYPGSVGVLWHVTSRIAIEPEITIANSRAESRFESTLTIGTTTVSTVTLSSTTDGWTASPGVGLRVYVGKWDNVSTYVSPAYVYHRSSTTATTTGPVGLPGSGAARTETRESESVAHDIRGMFGVQYAPHRKFGVFGEVGVRYVTSELPGVTITGSGGLGTASTSGTTRTLGNVGAVGVAFYF